MDLLIVVGGVFCFIVTGFGAVYVLASVGNFFDSPTSEQKNVTPKEVRETQEQYKASVIDGLLYVGKHVYKVSEIESISSGLFDNTYWLKFKSGQSVSLYNTYKYSYRAWFPKIELIEHLRDNNQPRLF